MNKIKYIIVLAPLILVVAIHLIGLHLDGVASCTIFSKVKEPCLAYGFDLSWFGTLATFNLIIGWVVGIYSILRFARLLGQDLPRPWGNHDGNSNS